MTIDDKRLFRENVLSGLRRSPAKFAELEHEQTKMVAVARDIGLTWGQIGEALGVSRQAAWERFASRIGTGEAGSADD